MGPGGYDHANEDTAMPMLTTAQSLPGDHHSGWLQADRTDETAAGWFVFGAWFSLTVVALGFVMAYGCRTPRWEDWFYVPFVTGSQRVSLPWLWENTQGHRIPILKLVVVACYSLFGLNSKPLLYLNALSLSFLALGLIWTIRKVRGRWCYADAFLPIVLLNLGHAETFCWAQTFAYVLPTCLETLLLVLIVTQPRDLSPMGLMIAGASLVLLPLTYGGGLVFATMMVPWMIYQGWIARRTAQPSRRGVHPVALVSAAATVVIVVLYFVGYRAANAGFYTETPIKPGLRVYGETALKYLASGFGGGARFPKWRLPGILIGFMMLTAFLCFLKELVGGRFTRDPRAIGLACFMMSCIAVACVVGVGRYAWGDVVLNSRYAASSVVVLVGCYFVWELLGPPSLVPPGRMLFFTTALMFLGANYRFGIEWEYPARALERDFLRDLRAAEPIPRLVARHSRITYYIHGRLEAYLRQLRDAGIAPYDRLPSDPSFRIRMLGPEPSKVYEIDWEGDGGKVLGSNAALTFYLDQPEFVGGLRFKISVVDPNGMLPALKVRWQSDTKQQLETYKCSFELEAGGEAEVLVYIDDRISRVEILPNNRVSSFRISSIELLLPEPGQNAPAPMPPSK